MGGVAQNLSDDQCVYSQTLVSNWEGTKLGIAVAALEKYLITVCTVQP